MPFRLKSTKATYISPRPPNLETVVLREQFLSSSPIPIQHSVEDIIDDVGTNNSGISRQNINTRALTCALLFSHEAVIASLGPGNTRKRWSGISTPPRSWSSLNLTPRRATDRFVHHLLIQGWTCWSLVVTNGPDLAMDHIDSILRDEILELPAKPRE